jgi:hypothetical protein
MATTNVPLDADWTLIVAAGAEFLLTLRDGALVEIAATDDTDPPEIGHGHTLSPQDREGASRSLIGSGTVWARLAPEETAVSATGVLSTWTA